MYPNTSAGPTTRGGPASTFSSILAFGLPLYRQIVDGIKELIAVGTLGPGDQLPSIRELATQLRINPSSAVKAYDELRHDEVIDMDQGRGTFVREGLARGVDQPRRPATRGRGRSDRPRSDARLRRLRAGSGLRRSVARYSQDSPEVSMSAIEAVGLRKDFRSKLLVLQRLDLAIPAGSIYGLLGSNGAGKTTLLKGWRSGCSFRPRARSGFSEHR